jgi:hypothetical protein
VNEFFNSQRCPTGHQYSFLNCSRGARVVVLANMESVDTYDLAVEILRIAAGEEKQ